MRTESEVSITIPLSKVQKTVAEATRFSRRTLCRLLREGENVEIGFAMAFSTPRELLVTASNTGNKLSVSTSRYVSVPVRDVLYGNSDVEINCLILLLNSRPTILLGSKLYVFIVGSNAGWTATVV